MSAHNVQENSKELKQQGRKVQQALVKSGLSALVSLQLSSSRRQHVQVLPLQTTQAA